MKKIGGVMKIVAGIAAATLWVIIAPAREVRLAERGQSQCVIVAPVGWTNNAVLPEGLPPPAANLLKERRTLFRDSIKDLALYLGRMSGAKIEIVEGLPDREKQIPIYIGAAAQKVFGPVGKTKAGLFAFRVALVKGLRGTGLKKGSEQTEHMGIDLIGFG